MPTDHDWRAELSEAIGQAPARSTDEPHPGTAVPSHLDPPTATSEPTADLADEIRRTRLRLDELALVARSAGADAQLQTDLQAEALRTIGTGLLALLHRVDQLERRLDALPTEILRLTQVPATEPASAPPVPAETPHGEPPHSSDPSAQ